jgi:hypothetical protein
LLKRRGYAPELSCGWPHDDVPLMPARLECNAHADLPRFSRLLAHARNVFGTNMEYRAFALVNGSESPPQAKERIRRMRAEGVGVDIICFTPHAWEHSQRYVNRETGWTHEDLASIQ